jgi:tRNA-splicing ligase RtcB (3'-phosphate/5'-hydroxy nucleic acid ligase)
MSLENNKYNMDAKEIRSGVWEFKEPDMNVPVRIYASKKIFSAMEEGVYKQAKNVSKLPGIQKASLVMPDGHYGYGFPIGGVAAFDMETGVVSPGGVGYDINCGVRLLTTDLTESLVRPHLKRLMDDLFNNIPSGVGEKSSLRVNDSELEAVAKTGARWAVEKGYGLKKDLLHIEENGEMRVADPSKVSRRAKDRGKPQIGTLGAGNHFLEVQRVDKIFDPVVAKRFGIIEEGQITVMVHCGSRGFGHQIADDYIKVMLGAAHKYGIKLPDAELACAPLTSREADDYLSAMGCGVNYAFCNRQVITHWVRETFDKIFKNSKLDLVYDVCHNIAKFEEHKIEGENMTVCVHRKGATRAFAAGRKEIPEVYRDIGQPVIIPGDMGRASYVLIGTHTAMEETFGSTCHGAGRTMSREGAIRQFRGIDIQKKLEARGEVIRATNPKVLAEEASEAYKDIDEVIRSVETAGIARAIARVTPIGVAKG